MANGISRTVNSSQWLRLLVISLFALLLTSCSHVRRHDGPPNYYVDETKVPNAVPKPEPLAKYGNMRSYRVFGKTYHVMKSSKHYVATGTASWYGTLFHDRRTSSGEPYNMLSMTAAHKTLPLPTYVEVTNLKNQRKVIVKVNDRGPFEQNRLIDLSYVAAKKLGMLGRGTAHVRIRALDPYQFNSLPPQFDGQGPLFYLQAGAFRNKAHAEKFGRRLNARLSIPVHVARSMSHRGYYRVQIGPFKTTASANKVISHLRDLGIKANKAYGA
jgi:rare lipoprotein A